MTGSSVNERCKGMKNQWYIGIDVSKNTLDVSIFTENEKLCNFPHKKINNDKQGFKELLSWIKGLGIQPKKTSFAMEYTGFYSWDIRCFLDHKKLKYRMENPLEIKYRSGVCNDKNDKLDSARIADYLCRYSDILTPSKLPEKNQIQLGALKKERKYYVEQRVCLQNRIQVVRYSDEKKRHQVLIDTLDKQIETVEKQMLAIIESDELLRNNYELLLSVPGIGPVNAINTIVNTENFTSFETARQYASYVGVAPHSKTSGKSVKWKPKPSRYCDCQAKADLSQAASCSIVYDKEMEHFYKRKIKNKNNADVIRKTMNAVKFKLIQRMFAVIRRRTPFEVLKA